MWVVVCLWSVIFARTKVTRFLQLSIKSTLSLNTVYGKYCTHRNPRIYNISYVSRGNGKFMVLHTLTYSIFRFVVSQFTLCIYQSCANLKVSREYCKRYSSISVKDNEMICNQCLYMSCACVIKQTLNCSFWTIQYTCFVISSIMSKLCLLFRPNGAWTDGTNLSLIDEVAMIKWVIWESYISQTSLVTYVFNCTFQVTIMWRTIKKSLKKILRQLLLLRNHLNWFGKTKRTRKHVWLRLWLVQNLFFWRASPWKVLLWFEWALSRNNW